MDDCNVAPESNVYLDDWVETEAGFPDCSWDLLSQSLNCVIKLFVESTYGRLIG